MKHYFYLLFLLLFIPACDTDIPEPKVVFPDVIQSNRISNAIELTWYSPLILMDVAPGFYDRNTEPQSYELYLSKNDTLNFQKITTLDRTEKMFVYAENQKGTDYFFKLKCLAKEAIPNFSNLIWINGGQNPSMESILELDVDYTFALGDVSNNGNKLLYSRNPTPENSSNNHVMVYDLQTHLESMILENAKNPEFSPDEKIVAFTFERRTYATPPLQVNLGIIDLASWRIDTLTGGNNEVQSPVFSDDGQSIFYLNAPYDQPQVLNEVNIDDGSIINLFTADDNLHINAPISMSSNDLAIAFKGNYHDGTQGIYSYDIKNKNLSDLIKQTFWQEYRASFSEDGQYLAFISSRSGTGELWVKGLSNSKFYQLTGSKDGYVIGDIIWSKSSEQIYIGGYYNEEYGVYAIDFNP